MKSFTGKIYAGKPLSDSRIQLDFQRGAAPRESGDIQIFVKTLTFMGSLAMQRDGDMPDAGGRALGRRCEKAVYAL